MKNSLLICILSLFLFCRCVEEIEPIYVDQTHIIIKGKIEYPSNHVTLSIMESSTTKKYEEKIFSKANIKLYTRTKNGNESMLADRFVFDSNKKQFLSTTKIPTSIGNSYWITISLPEREGIYQSTPETMLTPVPIKKIEKDSVYDDYYRIVFADPKEEHNQYSASFFFSNDEHEQGQLEITTSEDTLFNGNEDAYLERFFGQAGKTTIVSATLFNISPETYRFYKNLLIQGEQNENYGGTHYEIGNPEILFRTPPVQLQSNLYNTENPRELVLGNFAAMAASHYTKRFDN